LLVNCTFLHNQAKRGGAIGIDRGGNPSLLNCLLAGNDASGDGGGLDIGRDCNVSLVNCTVAGNTAKSGGGILAGGAALTLMNSILWGNTAKQGSGAAMQLRRASGDVLVRFSCVQDEHPGDGVVYPGADNLDTDPLFVQPCAAGALTGGGPPAPSCDLRLKTESPCIDAAASAPIPPDATDLDHDGNGSEPLSLDLERQPRFFSTADNGKPPAADMGAYEYQPDCNSNGLPDTCESSCGEPNGVCDRPGCGAKPDCNRNGVPDECEPDSDGDGKPDVCEAIYGDLDIDGDVDQTDFGIFQECMSGPKIAPSGARCSTADLDFDGDIDNIDVNLFARCMTGSGQPINVQCRQ
jgi:hypothetical protein